MARAKKEIKEEKKESKFYEGYDIKWLKLIGKIHPDYRLVEEYEKKFGEIKVKY